MIQDPLQHMIQDPLQPESCSPPQPYVWPQTSLYPTLECAIFLVSETLYLPLHFPRIGSVHLVNLR